MDNEIKKLKDSIHNEVTQCFNLFVIGLEYIEFNSNTKRSDECSANLFINDLISECIKVSFYVSDKEVIRSVKKLFMHDNHFKKLDDDENGFSSLKSMAYDKIQRKYSGFMHIQPNFINPLYSELIGTEQPSEIDKRFKIENSRLMRDARLIEPVLVNEFLPTKIGRKQRVSLPQYLLCYIDIIVQYAHARYNDWLKSITRKLGML